MRIRILDQAGQDLVDGFRFYEQQGAGLGDYFLDTVYAEIDSLLIYAGVHRRVLGFRRALVPRFPYAIYYEVADDSVLVWAVVDCRRQPASLVAKLKRLRRRR